MARRIILDCDPGIDDSVALSMALFHRSLDIVAITAVEGNAVSYTHLTLPTILLV